MKRIASFHKLANPKFRPMKMASAGFTLRTDEKSMGCDRCGITVSLDDLSEDINPIDLHKRRSPRCELLQRILSAPAPRERLSDILQRLSPPKQPIGKKKVAKRDEPAASARPKQRPKISSTKKQPSPSFEAEKEALQRSIAEQKERYTCKVCLDAPMNTVFLPCGHFLTCKECADKLRDCSICRATIRGTVAVLDLCPLKE